MNKTITEERYKELLEKEVRLDWAYDDYLLADGEMARLVESADYKQVVQSTITKALQEEVQHGLDKSESRYLVFWAVTFAEANGMYDIRYNRNTMQNFAASIAELGINPSEIESVTSDTVTTKENTWRI